MPSTAASHQSLRDAYSRIAMLLETAAQCVAMERGDAILRKWVTGVDTRNLSEYRTMCVMADAMLLSQDLLLSQPSGSGTTAFDRLARNRAAAGEAATVEILRKSRFRLLDISGPARAGGLAARDVVSGAALRIVVPDLPTLPPGTPVFARVAMLEHDAAVLVGAITPLDPAAFRVARSHTSAGSPGAFANARWAEAIFAHVVRHGTLDIRGVNRPLHEVAPDWLDDDWLDDPDCTTAALARDWVALGSAQPRADLLQRTRQRAEPTTILVLLDHAIGAKVDGRQAVADALERLLLVLMETVLQRELSGSGRLSLDRIADTVAAQIAAGRLPPQARAYFSALRLRLTGGSATRDADDPELARLMQRIQGLRAKTVEQGCTEQEALAAAEKVAELLDRYGLSLAELDFGAQTCNGIGVQTTRRRFAPVDNCIPAIAEFFDCRVWAEQATGETLRYVFFGLRADVAAAEYLHNLVERAFETETDIFRAGEIYAGMAGARRSATNSFQIGLSRAICAKLRVLRQARDARNSSVSGRDLVPLKAAMVDTELARLGLDLRKRGGGGAKHVLSEAYAAGEEAGQRFEFTPGITRAA